MYSCRKSIGESTRQRILCVCVIGEACLNAMPCAIVHVACDLCQRLPVRLSLSLSVSCVIDRSVVGRCLNCHSRRCALCGCVFHARFVPFCVVLILPVPPLMAHIERAGSSYALHYADMMMPIAIMVADTISECVRQPANRRSLGAICAFDTRKAIMHANHLLHRYKIRTCDATIRRGRRAHALITAVHTFGSLIVACDSPKADDDAQPPLPQAHTILPSIASDKHERNANQKHKTI